MSRNSFAYKMDFPFVSGIALLVILSIIILHSVAPFLFPTYFFYVFFSLIVFYLLLQVDFEVISLFYRYFYILSIIFLLVPLLIGQLTRGAVRWIPIGPLTIQPSEIVRPFLLVFFAVYLTEKKLTLKRFLTALILLALPVFIIMIQPSFGVAVITIIGFIGIFMSIAVPKKYFLFSALILLVLAPLVWGILKPYQKIRILSFVDPLKDRYGAGYNAIQAVISVGSGKIFGRGLGKGVQTQLAFLPEKHTDFIFASVAEEMGFVGVSLLLLGIFIILLKLIVIFENPISPAARTYIAGFFLTLFAQTFIHAGMNLGFLPVTGIPFPLVSAGGSSLLATLSGLAIALGAKKRYRLEEDFYSG